MSNMRKFNVFLCCLSLAQNTIDQTIELLVIGDSKSLMYHSMDTKWISLNYKNSFQGNIIGLEIAVYPMWLFLWWPQCVQ